MTTTIGENIRILRKRMKLTQRNFAKKLGVSPVSINHWETGKFFPNAMMLCDMADLFGCSVDELLGREQNTDKAVRNDD